MNTTISVVMPVYNGQDYLKKAIESILNQTFKDFEFIIINDGSTDKTKEIIESYTDKRIVYIKNERNLGLSKSFNIGIRTAQGEYIARMDADDIALPQRLEKQLKFLKDNPEIGVLGSNIKILGTHKIFKRPENHQAIKWQCLFSTPMVHPTIMAKASVLKDNPYDENLHNSEDYELWSRLIFEKNVKFANLPEALLLYRVFEKSFTQSLNLDKKASTTGNIIKNIERYTTLSERDKQNLTNKSCRALSIYRRIAKEFEKREHFKPNLNRYYLSLIREFLLR